MGSKEMPNDIAVGMSSERHTVTMTFDQRLGNLYPFSLQEKLKVITESSTWYTESGSTQSPWGRPIIPMEMISVLLRYNDNNFPFSAGGPAVQLFADQEIRLISGPLFVGDPYDIEHQVVALVDTRRTESCWIRTGVYAPGSDRLIAEMLLNMASFKSSPTA